ncbi:NAD(P)/FAD-dependent oxidoreductase [Metabacillus litoralis]|uniref:NAD(P)/FAD-dependent oxidoreductase n=1 Tax=Metabacillus litoralis TaxID=152268 RepID=UPI001CFD3CE4|nr:FAD-dependent oxidoreductase [Metabacillus litoralis]
MKKPVVVIGAGISGVMAASIVRENGFDHIVVLDKGRSVGGRMATRRIDEGKVDHGAQFMTVRTEIFQSYVEKWENQDLVSEWFGDPYPRYKGNEGMNSIVKKLAEQLPVKLNTKVVSVQQEKADYLIQTDNGERMEARGIILTAPAPQSLDMIQHLEIGEYEKQQLEAITFNPCFVLLITLNQSSQLPESGYRIDDLPDGIERIVDHQKKGISSIPTVCVYSTGEWAKTHDELTEEEIRHILLEKIKGIISAEHIIDIQHKRWRYSEAISTVSEPFLDLKLEKPFLIAGDAFLTKNDISGRTRIESAFLSGLAAGQEMVNRLKE